MQIFEVNMILRRVREDAEELSEIQTKLTAYRIRAMSISSPVLSDMPKSFTNAHRDLSDYYSRAEVLILAEKTLVERKARHEAEARRLISLLRSPQREVFELHYLDGISTREIANETGKTQSMILWMLYDGRKRIAEAA